MGGHDKTSPEGVIMSDRIAVILMVAIFGVVLAVADANWPSHMGPQNALADAIVSLLP